METILIWLGSGFAFAFGFVLCMGIVVVTARLRGDPNSEMNQQINQQIKLMRERNELDKRKIDALEQIAKTLKANEPPVA